MDKLNIAKLQFLLMQFAHHLLLHYADMVQHVLLLILSRHLFAYLGIHYHQGQMLQSYQITLNILKLIIILHFKQCILNYANLAFMIPHLAAYLAKKLLLRDGLLLAIKMLIVLDCIMVRRDLVLAIIKIRMVQAIV